ncbi:MAG: VWA domain-containing protein [Oscillospiraceae bacterium]|nr:VWA domain-containing protein [Oscillospiraceae bacterium]
MKEKNNAARIGLVIAVLALIIGAVAVIGNLGAGKDMTAEQALNKLDSLYSALRINRLPLFFDPDFTAGDETEKTAVLPDISEYPFIVNPTTDDFLTIYASPEKTEWLIEVGNKFNQSGASADGKPVSVGIRAVSSSLAAELIASKKYTPDVYAPSSALYGELLVGRGVKLRQAEGRTAGNVTGVVLSAQKINEIKEIYNAQSLDIETIIQSVLSDELSLGYTSPSSDENGFHFVLALFAAFDTENPLSEESVESLRKFQDKILFVAYDNEQLKSALTGGILDAVVLDYQSYSDSPALKSSYDFVPVGERRDNPIYEIGDVGALKSQITQKFAEFCKSSESQKSAADKGFNNLNDYAPAAAAVTGAAVGQAYEIYNREKHGSSVITAVFVADISGSMEGSPLLNLKASLYRAIDVIDSNANIGLVTFSDSVNIALPIAKFDVTQKSCFSNAVKNMTAGGGTAMFDAIVTAQKMLTEAKERSPNTKLLLFVLTDGESNIGYTFKDVEKMTKGLRIPVYTIGYNADIEVLQKLSEINEAAAMDADSENIIYRLESLFRSQT